MPSLAPSGLLRTILSSTQLDASLLPRLVPFGRPLSTTPSAPHQSPFPTRRRPPSSFHALQDAKLAHLKALNATQEILLENQGEVNSKEGSGSETEKPVGIFANYKALPVKQRLGFCFVVLLTSLYGYYTTYDLVTPVKGTHSSETSTSATARAGTFKSAYPPLPSTMPSPLYPRGPKDSFTQQQQQQQQQQQPLQSSSRETDPVIQTSRRAVDEKDLEKKKAQLEAMKVEMEAWRAGQSKPKVSWWEAD